MIAIVIDEYDAAIAHYVNDLGFTLIEDKEMTPEKRWVVVAPSNDGAKVLLARAATDQQKAAINTVKLDFPFISVEDFLRIGFLGTEFPHEKNSDIKKKISILAI